MAKAHCVDTDTVSEHEESLFTLSKERIPNMIVEVGVEDKQLQMQVDTGASVSIVSESTWKQCFRHL